MRINILAEDDPLYPVQAFFNTVLPGSFILVLENLVRGSGAGINGVGCDFPADLDPGEETFEGVRCYLYEDSVVLDEDTFARFVRLACEAYLSEYPEDKGHIDTLLESRGWA